VIAPVTKTNGAQHQAENERRAANGLQPKQRRRRRHTTEQRITAANTPP